MPNDQMLRPLISSDPQLAGELAFEQFCTPRLSRHRSRDHDVLVERARFHLRNATSKRIPTSEGELQAYVFEPEGSVSRATVLFVHGWTGEASFMTAFAEQFRKRGFRAVLFDLPAHGKSAGDRTSLIACAHAVRQAAEALGPVHFVVAHSLGGLAALLAGGGGRPMPRAYPFLAFVLVATPNRFSSVTDKFGEELALSPAAQRVYEQRLEGIAQRRIADFTGANLLTTTGRPALIMHAHDDDDVAFAHAQEIVAACPSARLQSFDDLGHRRILYAPPVVRAAMSYLAAQRERIVSQPQEIEVS
jgi:pimeloyl-ACP methyl ester carboxylesterase